MDNSVLITSKINDNLIFCVDTNIDTLDVSIAIFTDDENGKRKVFNLSINRDNFNSFKEFVSDLDMQLFKARTRHDRKNS
jgi:hypothetical protein